MPISRLANWRPDLRHRPFPGRNRSTGASHRKLTIGHKVAADLTRADVQLMVDCVSARKTAGVFKTGPRGKARVDGGAGTAARVAGFLGGVWTWAEKRGYVAGQSPVKGVEKRKDQAKNRTLSRDELKRLGEVLEANNERFPAACSAIRLIALTGLRKSEAVGLRWSEIDFDGQCLRLENSKTGRSMRPLGKPALDLLRALPRLSREYLFPSRDNTQASTLKKVIANIFDEAGLHDARSHDLRRTFATIAAELGYSDGTIGDMLGHAPKNVTAAHYIRRVDSVLIAAATGTASAIDRALRSEEAVVIALDQRRG